MNNLFNVVVSIGRSVTTRQIFQGALDIERFKNPVVIAENNSDKDGLYFTAALFSSHRRRNNDITRCVLLVLDIDEIARDQALALFDAMRSDGLEFCYYTTLSHTPEKPRFRLILQPSRPVTKTEYPLLIDLLMRRYNLEKLSKRTGGEVDRVSHVANQPMFFPMVHAGREDAYRMRYVRGRQLDIDMEMVDIAEQEAVTPSDGSLTISDSYDDKPLTAPNGVTPDLWLSCVCRAYPASDCDYHQWLEMGMALYHQTDSKGFGLWLQWSRKNEDVHGVKYGEEEMRYKWDSFVLESERRPITLGTILNHARPDGVKVTTATYAMCAAVAESPNGLQLLTHSLRDDPYITDHYQLRVFAKHYIKAHQRLEIGERMAMAEVLEFLINDEVTELSKEYFHDNYALASYDAGNVYELGTNLPIAVSVFNAKYRSVMPKQSGGNRRVPLDVLAQELGGYRNLRVVDDARYVIDDGTIIPGDGLLIPAHKLCLNQYVQGSRPQPDFTFDMREGVDEEIVGMIERHFSLLADGDVKFKKLLYQHLGHLRQHPNKRLHFAMALLSQAQGIGKSTLVPLYRAVLGQQQVNVIRPSDMTERYNSFIAAPHQVTFVEEVQNHYGNSAENAALGNKDSITSDVVSVRMMHRDIMPRRVTTCIVFLSNDIHALGLEGVGRRWAPNITRLQSDASVDRILGMPRDQFFTRYYELMETHSDRFSAYFETVALGGFSTESPPETATKKRLRLTSPDSRCEDLIKEAIDDSISLDITAHYVLITAVVFYVKTNVSVETDPVIAKLAEMSDRALYSVVERTLFRMRYIPLQRAEGQIRIPFERTNRPYRAAILVSQQVADNGDEKTLLRLVKKIKADRQEHLRPSRVVNLDGTEFFEI